MTVPMWSRGTMATPVRAAAGALLALAVAGCRPDAVPSAPAPGEAPLDGRGGPAASAPTVTSAAPSEAPGDTTLDVTVYGTGFTTGARATWSLAGDTTQVQVLSTSVVNSKQLTARIAIPASAAVATYDIVVTLVDGKKGVGAELFAVTEGNPDATYYFPNDATLGVRGDGLFATSGTSMYGSGTCGASGTIFVSGSGDATMGLQGTATGKGKCTRALYIDYGDGRVDKYAAFLNVNRVHGPTFTMPVGAIAKRGLNLADARCDGLRWKAILNDGTVTGADSVIVTRESADSWLVESQPYPNNRAYCVLERRTFHIALRFRVRSSWPLE